MNAAVGGGATVAGAGAAAPAAQPVETRDASEGAEHQESGGGGRMLIRPKSTSVVVQDGARPIDVPSVPFVGEDRFTVNVSFGSGDLSVLIVTVTVFDVSPGANERAAFVIATKSAPFVVPLAVE